jgi:DNA-binding NarL/FixJ family response regulator
MDGFATIQWLHTAYPELPVVILSNRETDLTMAKLIHLGARAILKKSVDVKKLQKAIFRVKEEGYYFNDPASRNLLIAIYKEENKKEVKPALTEKEWEFLKLATTDLTYGQIAALLDVSERGVDKTRNRLFEKLGVQNRVMLAVKAIDNGIAA